MRRPHSNSAGLTRVRDALAILAALAAAACGPAGSLEEIRGMHEAGDYAGSIEPLRKLLDEQPNDAEINYRYGYALAATGQPGLAEWALRKAMDDPEWLAPAGIRLAHTALGAGNYATAVDLVDRVLRAEPDHIEALRLRANAHAHSRLNPEAALADAARLLEIDPDDLEAYEPRILALLSLNRAEEAGQAIEDLGRGIASHGADPELSGWHCATAAIFADESREEELAQERWIDCTSRFPGHGNVVGNAIKFYDARGDSTRSLEVLRAALEAEPSSRIYRTALAARLRDGGEDDEAEAILVEGTESGTPAERAGSWIDLARHYQEYERRDDYARAIDRAVDLANEVGSPSADLILEQADAKLLAGDFDAALAIAANMPISGHRLMIEARVAHQRGDNREALELYDRAFAVWPDNAFARYSAADAAVAIGDFDRALEEYRNAIRIAPGSTDARTRGAAILLAERQPAEAIVLLDTKAQEEPLDRDGVLLSARAAAAAGMGPRLSQQLQVASVNPDGGAPLFFAAALGIRDRGGPQAAVGALGAWEDAGVIDLGDVRHADSLQLLVESSQTDADATRAESQVRALLKVHPETAQVHAILGLALERRSAPAGEIRSAYAAAVELDESQATALAGLARLAGNSDAERSISLWEQAAAAEPANGVIQREAAAALAGAGRAEEARQLLERALEVDPTDGKTASQLAELRLAGGDPGDRTLALATQALRFGGGPSAEALLARVQLARAEPDGRNETP